MNKINLGILLLFHIIGILIFIFYPEGVSLSYITLLICGLSIFIGEKNKSKASIAYLSIFFLGYLIEFIGVHTNFLFGNYVYGNALGYKLGGIPIIIGINWLAIVISSTSLIKRIKFIKNNFFIALISALLCTTMDYIIEPTAIKFDYWSWKNNIIPISNYVDWFIFSFFFSYIYISMKTPINKIATYLFFIWIIFFTLIKWLA